MKKLFLVIISLLIVSIPLTSCGEKSCEHEYFAPTVLQSATCVEGAKLKQKCRLCSYENMITTSIDTNAHALSKVEISIPSLCDTEGKCVAVCERCSAEVFFALDKDATKHRFDGKAECQGCGAFNSEVTKINNRLNESNVRIAANNIYYHQPKANETYAVRKPILLESFKYFDSDVLLLQECGYNRAHSPSKTTWHDEIDGELVKMGYTYVDSAPKTVENATPIWYRADKLELLDSNFKLFETNSYRSESYLSDTKSYTSAVFKDKTSGETFACISTHFTWAAEGSNPSPNELRRRNAIEVKNEVLALRNKHGKELFVVVMGDLNCEISGDPYDVLDLQMDDVKTYDGVVFRNRDTSTFHTVGSYPASDGKLLDHTFLSGSGFVPVQFQYVLNDQAINSTDHIPMILDIALDKN